MPFGIYASKLGYPVKPVAPKEAYQWYICFDLSTKGVGLSRERLAVRLALTLQYAETVIWDTTGNWRTSIQQMLAPAEVKPHSIELQTTPFTIHDGMILTIGCALLAFALL
ncbi:MAG: hypothetical protein IPP36_11380 [Nitrosomonadales bacterium]|nr:hypothetical protein [Nitrosomonadales bacterium]